MGNRRCTSQESASYQDNTGICAIIQNPVFWAVIPIVLGIIGLLGWLIRSNAILTMYPKSLPVSPNSAFIFILLGFFLIAAEKSATDQRSKILQKVLITISLVIASLTLFDLVTGNLIHISWLLSLSNQPTTMDIQGQMSPISAVLFIILALGYLFHQEHPRYGKITGIFIVSVGAVMILGYWYGAPLLYGGVVKPVTFLTALAFFFSGLCLLMRTSPEIMNTICGKEFSVHHQILKFFLPFITGIILIEGWIITLLIRFTDKDLVLAIAILTLISLTITTIFSRSFSRIITNNLALANEKREAAERALLDSLTRIKIATSAAGMGFWVWDLKTDEIFWDEQTYQLYGIPSGTHITIQTWILMIHPDDRPTFGHIKRMKQQTEFHSEFRIMLSDSSVKTLEGHGRIIFADDGLSERMVGMNWDITPKVQLINSLNYKNEELGSAYEELASQDEELQAQFKELEQANLQINNAHQFTKEVISQAGEGIIVLESDRKINVWNQFMEDYTGISADEIIGKDISEVFENLPDLALPDEVSHINQALSGEQTVTRDIHFSHKNAGKSGWFTATYAPHYDSKGSVIGVIIIVQDITRRKGIERRLIQSEVLLKSSESLGKIGGWEWDTTSKQVFWTEETYLIHEIDPSLPAGGDEQTMLCLSCFNETDQETLCDAFEQCVNTGKPYNLEFQFTTKKGNKIWVRTQAEAEWEEDKVVRVHGTIMDITKERLFIEDLEKERLSHRRILDLMPDGVYTVDADYKVRYTNPVIQKLFDDPGDKLCFEYINNRSEVCPWCYNKEIFAEKSIQTEWKDQRTGNIYELFGVPSRTTEGEICALYFFHDITELRNTQEKLAEANEYLSRLIRYANAPILVWNADNQIKEFNNAIEILSGYHSEEVIGKPYSILFPPEHSSQLADLFDSDKEQRCIYEKEMPVIRPDGEVIPVIWNAAKINDYHGELLAIIAQGRDITREKKLEAEKSIAITQIKKNFAELAILNDGIRNPLMIIAFLTETRCPDIFTDIEDQIKRIDQIVNQLDTRWIESESVINFLNKYYAFPTRPDESDI